MLQLSRTRYLTCWLQTSTLLNVPPTKVPQRSRVGQKRQRVRWVSRTSGEQRDPTKKLLICFKTKKFQRVFYKCRALGMSRSQLF